MPIAVEEEQKYRAFIEEIVRDLKSLEVAPDDVIWHYTTGDALLSIIDSGTLYSTQVSCLNDTTELRYAAKLSRNAHKDLLDRVDLPPEETRLLERMIAGTAGVEDPAAEAVLNSGWFVTCLSKNRDDLSQWRAYGPGDNGYAIGFRLGGLFSSSSLVLRVHYDSEAHKEGAARIARATLQFFREGLNARPEAARQAWEQEFLIRWDFLLGRINPMVKDPAFQSESEYRVIHELEPQEAGKLRFRQKNALMSRHLPLTFSPPPNLAADMLPIVEVMVGPSRHKEISRASVEALLRQKGYSVPVSTSRIPFQTT